MSVRTGSLSTVTTFPANNRGSGLWSLAFRRLKRNRLALAGLLVIAAFVALAVLAPLIAPYDPQQQNLRETFASPSWDHLMGTDNLGRAWFSSAPWRNLTRHFP